MKACWSRAAVTCWCRSARDEWTGTGRLRAAVEEEFLMLDEQERDMRSAMAKLETGFMRRFGSCAMAEDPKAETVAVRSFCRAGRVRKPPASSAHAVPGRPASGSAWE